MKVIPHSILLLACCAVAWGQTNMEPAETEAVVTGIEEEGAEGGGAAETPPVEAEPETPTTHIYSDTVELGVKSRSAVYRGNVRLEDPRIFLTCEQLTAEVPEEGGRVDRVVAETNVVILLFDEEGSTNRAFADRAVYSYIVTDSDTNEVVELTGDPDPHIETPKGELYGNPIVWNRTKDKVWATNQRMIYRADPTNLTSMISQTKTNALSSAEHSEGSDSPVSDDSAATEDMPDE